MMQFFENGNSNKINRLDSTISEHSRWMKFILRRSEEVGQSEIPISLLRYLLRSSKFSSSVE